MCTYCEQATCREKYVSFTLTFTITISLQIEEEAEKALNRERGDTEELMPSSRSKKPKGGLNNSHHLKHSGRHLSTVEEEENSGDSDDSVVVYDTSRV